MSAGVRYKFFGSHLFVQTGYESDTPLQAITAITRTQPPVITATGSDYDDGTIVKPSGIVGMTELNGKLLVTDDGTTNNFEAAGVDARAYGAYVSGGTLQVADMTEFCELTDANQQDGAADQDEVTTICSTAKEFEQGLSDTGTLQLDYNFAPNSPIQAALRAAKISGEVIAFKVVLAGAGGIVILFGTVQQSSFQGGVGTPVWKGSSTIKLSGDMYVLEAAA